MVSSLLSWAFKNSHKKIFKKKTIITIFLLVIKVALIFFLFNFQIVSVFFFWPHRAACGISVPQPGIEPRPQQCQHQVLTTSSLGNSPNIKSILKIKESQEETPTYF